MSQLLVWTAPLWPVVVCAQMTMFERKKLFSCEEYTTTGVDNHGGTERYCTMLRV